VGGRDRTGLIAMVLLSAVGVPAEAIAADHALSTTRLRRYYASSGEEDQEAAIAELLRGEGITADEAIQAALEAAGPSGCLREDDVAALRRRLLA
jgi:protein tyrosine/serine phosphatase